MKLQLKRNIIKCNLYQITYSQSIEIKKKYFQNKEKKQSQYQNNTTEQYLYGQTGAGIIYSIVDVLFNNEKKGIIPGSFDYMFDKNNKIIRRRKYKL